MKTETLKTISNLVKDAVQELSRITVSALPPEEAEHWKKAQGLLESIHTSVTFPDDTVISISQLLSITKMLEGLEQATSEAYGLPCGIGRISIKVLTDSCIKFDYIYNGHKINTITLDQ